MKDIANAYKVLGISENSSINEIRERYHLLVKRYHPDSFAGEKANVISNNKVLSEINEAYNLLCKYLKNLNIEKDKETKIKYDKKQILAAESAFKKGVQLLNGKDINNAVNTFETISRQFPDNEKYMIYYIKALMEKPRMLHKARDLCLDLISKKPFEPDILKLMGDIYLKAGFKDTALEYYEKAVEMGYDKNLCPELKTKKDKKGFFKSLFSRGL